MKPNNRPPTTLALPVLALFVIMSLLSMTGCGATLTERQDVPTLDRDVEPAAYLPEFQFQFGTLADGTEVAYLNDVQFDRAATFIRHSFANRDALNERNEAWLEAADAVDQYADAVDDLDASVRARAWSCRIGVGLAGALGLAVGL